MDNSASSVFASGPPQSGAPLPIDDVPVDAVEAAYDERDLDRASDDELVRAVAAVVAEPREGPANSFVLHAPLELTARARLLASTPAEHRRLARLRLVSIAARYQANEPADLGPAAADGNPNGIDTVVEAIDRGDLVGVDAAIRSLVDPGVDAASIVGPLANAIADRTAAAAHGPIFLATLTEAPGQANGWLPMLRPLARELARRPDWRIGWIDRMTATGEGGPNGSDRPADADALFRALADPPRLGVPGSSFIHPLLMQVDAPGVADVALGPIAGPDRRLTIEAARAVTRVAALSMVRDDPGHAPYGWTHCLTLPQAVLTLAPLIEAGGGHPLAIAATHVLAFRAAQGAETLDHDDPLLTAADPATVDQRRASLVVEAASRHDAHIAKYLLASSTAAEADPEASELHLTAAEHLLSIWDELGPDPDDLLASARD